MGTVAALIKNPAKIVFVLDKMGISRLIPDKAYLRLKYKASMGKRLNLRDPKTYNEKLQWLKLRDRNSEYTKLVDKYEVKPIVAAKIGEEYIIPTLGVWDRIEDIDFDALPDRFVLKCTHDSGGLLICRDKSQFDIEAAKRKLNRSLKRNFYFVGREWPYKNVKPRILAERYIEDAATKELRDYKFYCFDGVARALLIVTDRQTESEETKFDFYSMDLKHLDFKRGHANAKKELKKPETFAQMRALAEELSKDFSHVRVDFYEVDGKIYFGELTFFPGNGMVPFEPEEWDTIFGNWIRLPEK